MFLSVVFAVPVPIIKIKLFPISFINFLWTLSWLSSCINWSILISKLNLEIQRLGVLPWWWPITCKLTLERLQLLTLIRLWLLLHLKNSFRWVTILLILFLSFHGVQDAAGIWACFLFLMDKFDVLLCWTEIIELFDQIFILSQLGLILLPDA